MINKVAVLDIGSYETKVGFSGTDKPTGIIPSIVDRPNQSAGIKHEHRAGNNADIYHCKILPILENGIVTNWDDFEQLIKNAYEILGCESDENPVLITESPASLKSHREKCAQIMFETFDIPSLYISSQASLSVLATGRDTGIVLGIGEGTSYAVPVYDCILCKNALKTSPISGLQITDYFNRSIGIEAGRDFTNYLEKKDIYNLKNKFCFVANDYNEVLENAPEFCPFDKLPTVRDIEVRIGQERFKAPELLFQPELNGIHGDSITNVLFDSIMSANIDLRKDLFSNIILSGGTTMLDGFTARIQKELAQLETKMKIEFIKSSEHNLLPWKGGSILASRPLFQQMLMSHDDYNEDGILTIHRQFIS